MLLRWKKMWEVTVGFTLTLQSSVIGGNDKYCNSYFQTQRKQKQYWSNCHSCSVPWVHHSITETMNKIISTDPHCFLTAIGPSGSGKTHPVAQLLQQHRQIFKPNFEQFVYFYNHFQAIYEELLLSLGQQKFYLCQGVDWSFLDKVTASNKPTLLIFDDVYQNVSDTKEFLDLAMSGRHQNLRLLVLKHNLYQQSRHSKTIDLNVTQMLLLRNPRDNNQIDCLGRQLGCRELLLNSYKRATQDQFGHLLIDLDPRLNENRRLSSHIISKPAIFYCNSNDKVIELNDSFTVFIYDWVVFII